MEGMRLQEYQLKAIDSIRRATERGQKQIIVDMPVGYGRGIIVIKTAEIISNLRSGRILILTSTISKKEIYEKYPSIRGSRAHHRLCHPQGEQQRDGLF